MRVDRTVNTVRIGANSSEFVSGGSVNDEARLGLRAWLFRPGVRCPINGFLTMCGHDVVSAV